MSGCGQASWSRCCWRGGVDVWSEWVEERGCDEFCGLAVQGVRVGPSSCVGEERVVPSPDAEGGPFVGPS